MKKQLLGIGVAIGMAILISLFTAHGIEAQYSTPVKVVNTTSAPALTSRMDDHGRIPYQSTNLPITCAGSSSCVFSFPFPVPSGHRLVVERFTGSLAASNPTDIVVRLRSGDDDLSTKAAFQVVPGMNGFTSNFNEPILGYFDAGETPKVVVFLTGSTFFAASHFFLAGYMLDCSAAPCAAIAQ